MLELDVQLTLHHRAPRALKPAPFELVVDGEVVALGEPVHPAHRPRRRRRSASTRPPTAVTLPASLPGSKRIELWLPQVSAVDLRAVRVDDGATVEATAVEQPALVYRETRSATAPARSSPTGDVAGVGGPFRGRAGPHQSRLRRDSACSTRSWPGPSATLDADVVSDEGGGEHHRRGRRCGRRPLGPGAARVPRHHPGGEGPTSPILVVSPIFSPFGENHPGPAAASTPRGARWASMGRT